MLASFSLGAPLVFPSISVFSSVAEVTGVPKMCFRPMLEKEASVFTAGTVFLLTRGVPGTALLREPSAGWTSLPGVLPGPPSREMQNSEVEVRKDTDWFFVSVRFPGTSIWGRRGLDGCSLALGAEADQVPDQEGDWKSERGASSPEGRRSWGGDDARPALLPPFFKADSVFQKRKPMVEGNSALRAGL